MADETENNEMSEEEKMAAEWAAMADDEGEEGEEGDAAAGEGGEGDGDTVERALSQDEIDNLLGVDSQDDGGGKSGIEALINSAFVNYERLPMLDIVFDRLVRMMSTSLRNLTSDNVEISLEQVTNVRFGDYLNSIPLPALLSVFKAEEWDNYGLLVVDSAMIYAIVDVLLGGRHGTAAMRIEGRPYTTIERNLVERLVHAVLQDLTNAFAPLSPVNFAFERLEINPRFATIAREANAAIVAKVRIEMEDRGGQLDLLIPYATLEPVRELLLQMFMGEKFGRDSIWESHLAQELWQTDVELSVVLDEINMSLGDVLDLKPGSRLMLGASPNNLVDVKCGDEVMFRGAMGRKRGSIAVKLETDEMGLSRYAKMEKETN